MEKSKSTKQRRVENAPLANPSSPSGDGLATSRTIENTPGRSHVHVE